MGLGDLDLTPPLSVVVGLLGLQTAYWLCAVRYRDRLPGSAPVPVGQQFLFAQGIATLFVALGSPLHDLSDHYLFSAHMVQHLLLTLVAAPLLLAGTPGWLLAHLLRATGLGRVARWALHPLIAFFAYNLTFALAHLPAVYELALTSDALHAVEHAIFLGTALLLWMPILSPLPKALPRYHTLGQMLYLFLQTLPATLIGALLAGAPRPMYPTYAQAPRVFDSVSALDDQKLGALLMWVGGGVYFLAALGIVFFIWAAREEAGSRRPVGATL